MGKASEQLIALKEVRREDQLRLRKEAKDLKDRIEDEKRNLALRHWAQSEEEKRVMFANRALLRMAQEKLGKRLKMHTDEQEQRRIENYGVAERELEKRQAERLPDANSRERLVQLARAEQEQNKERARRQAVIAEINEKEDKARKARRAEEDIQRTADEKERGIEQAKARRERKIEAAGLPKEVTPELLEAR